MARKATDKEIRAAAVAKFGESGRIEFDTVPLISRAKGNPDKGAYVQAWVWVYDEEARKEPQS